MRADTSHKLVTINYKGQPVKTEQHGKEILTDAVPAGRQKQGKTVAPYGLPAPAPAPAPAP